MRFIDLDTLRATLTLSYYASDCIPLHSSGVVILILFIALMTGKSRGLSLVSVMQCYLRCLSFLDVHIASSIGILYCGVRISVHLSIYQDQSL